MNIFKRIKKEHLLAPILYNFLMIVIFFIIYSLIRDQFGSNRTSDKMNIQDKGTPPSIIDIIGLAVTLQNAVGVPMVYPKTNLAKFFTILQQFLLLFGNLLVLYIML